jgi:hypothetical protein
MRFHIRKMDESFAIFHLGGAISHFEATMFNKPTAITHSGTAMFNQNG